MNVLPPERVVKEPPKPGVSKEPLVRIGAAIAPEADAKPAPATRRATANFLALNIGIPFYKSVMQTVYQSHPDSSFQMVTVLNLGLLSPYRKNCLQSFPIY